MSAFDESDAEFARRIRAGRKGSTAAAELDREVAHYTSTAATRLTEYARQHYDEKATMESIAQSLVVDIPDVLEASVDKVSRPAAVVALVRVVGIEGGPESVFVRLPAIRGGMHGSYDPTTGVVNIGPPGYLPEAGGVSVGRMTSLLSSGAAFRKLHESDAELRARLVKEMTGKTFEIPKVSVDYVAPVARPDLNVFAKALRSLVEKKS